MLFSAAECNDWKSVDWHEATLNDWLVELIDVENRSRTCKKRSMQRDINDFIKSKMMMMMMLKKSSWSRSRFSKLWLKFEIENIV